MRIYKWLALLALAALSGGYSPFGWSPPPPNFGGFVPDAQIIDLGNVPLNQSARVTITYLVDPRVVPDGPFYIYDPPYAFNTNQEAAFSVDLSHTSCVAGGSISKTNGCFVTMTFSPTSVGSKQAEFVFSGCYQTPSPCLPFSGLHSTLVFTAVGLAPPIPQLSLTTLILLGGILLTSGFCFLSRRVRAP
jgi:hypothetical protein